MPGQRLRPEAEHPHKPARPRHLAIGVPNVVSDRVSVTLIKMIMGEPVIGLGIMPTAATSQGALTCTYVPWGSWHRHNCDLGISLSENDKTCCRSRRAAAVALSGSLSRDSQRSPDDVPVGAEPGQRGHLLRDRVVDLAPAAAQLLERLQVRACLKRQPPQGGAPVPTNRGTVLPLWGSDRGCCAIRR